MQKGKGIFDKRGTHIDKDPTFFAIFSIYNFPYHFLLRQKLRKYIKNEFEDDVAKFRENPDEDDDIEDAAAQEEKDEEEDGSDEERLGKPDFGKAEMFKKGKLKQKTKDYTSYYVSWCHKGRYKNIKII